MRDSGQLLETSGGNTEALSDGITSTARKDCQIGSGGDDEQIARAGCDGVLRQGISLLAAVQPPTLWWRIDVSGNRRRHPADTEAEKDQQDALRALAAPDRPCEYENDRPGDGEASAVDPIVSDSKHLVSLFFSKDTMYNFSSVGTFIGESRIPT